jgi:hypothetical protein
MIEVSGGQSKSRLCGGARFSGNIGGPADGSLAFRCGIILSISPVVRHSLFKATIRRLDNDLNVTGSPLPGLDKVNQCPASRECPGACQYRLKPTFGEHRFETLHPGHRLISLGRRLPQPAPSGGLTSLAPPAPLRRSDTHS